MHFTGKFFLSLAPNNDLFQLCKFPLRVGNYGGDGLTKHKQAHNIAQSKNI